MGLLPNAISPATPEFRSKSSQNFLAYLSDRPQNLFNDFASKFRSFVTKAHSATDPLGDQNSAEVDIESNLAYTYDRKYMQDLTVPLESFTVSV